MAERNPRIQLSDEELAGLLELMDDADSMELKLTIPQADHASTAAALRVDPLEAQIRQIFFFDTPELTLDRLGIVVRARRVQGKGDDSVVKLRPVVPNELPGELRRSPAFNVEVDAMPGGYVCSGSLKGTPKVRVRDAVAGEHPLRKIFSKQQRALFEERAPDGLTINDLAVLGPIFVLKLRFAPRELGRKLTAEMWLYPDGSRVLELSTKCAPRDAFQVAAETRAFLTGVGVPLSGEQQTKTRKALQYFSKQAAARARAAAPVS